MELEWHNIIGFDGRYVLTTCGKIKSVKRTGIDKRGHKFTVPERIMTPFPDSHGYPMIRLYDGKNNAKHFFIHRLLAITFLSNPENKPFVNHKDGIVTNFNLSNLEWVTKLENEHHASKNGLLSHGDRHYKAKIKDSDVQQMKLLRIQGMKFKKIATIFDITSQHCAALLRGVYRKHLNISNG